MVLYFISHNVTRTTHSNKNNASFTAHLISTLRQQVLQISETETSGPNSVVVLYHILWDSLLNNLVLAFLVISTIRCSRSYVETYLRRGNLICSGLMLCGAYKKVVVPFCMLFFFFSFFEFHWKTALQAQNYLLLLSLCGHSGICHAGIK